MTAADARIWPSADGTPIACVEKLKLLRENERELAQSLRDAFDDAVLMGVPPETMRAVLAEMVATLKDPRA